MSGRDLERFVHERLRVSRLDSVAALARQAVVDEKTLRNWFQDKTTPRTGELGRVGDALGVGIRELWAAYGGEISPSTADERRVAELIEDAYRRGYRDGWRDRADGAT